MSETTSLVIELNGTNRTFFAGVTLATVVADQGSDPAAIATAVNGTFVARHLREACALHHGDIVQFFSPMVGG